MKALVLLLFPCLAFGQVIQISSPRNAVNSDVTTGISLSPLDDAGNAVAALVQGWPAGSSMAESTPFVFPASGTPYMLTGVEAEISVKGTGFNLRRTMLVDYPLNPPKHVPSGITVNAVVFSPLSGLGSVTITLGPDTSPPSGSTLAVVPSQTSSVVSWTAATDNVGVSGYVLERAIGTVTFAPIITTQALTFADSGLTLATVYSYRVKATDSAGNQGPYSNVAVITTASPAPKTGTSLPGQCTGPTVATTGCSTTQIQPQLVDSTGGVWTLVKGVPMLNGKDSLNPYKPNVRYLFVVTNGPAIQIRSQNSNGTYACWLGTAWGC